MQCASGAVSIVMVHLKKTNKTTTRTTKASDREMLSPALHENESYDVIYALLILETKKATMYLFLNQLTDLGARVLLPKPA